MIYDSLKMPANEQDSQAKDNKLNKPVTYYLIQQKDEKNSILQNSETV